MKEEKEGHGAIQFPGTISSISWTVDTNENWHGFTIGIAASLIKESDTFRSEADGNFQSVISDKHGYQIVLDSQYENRFQAMGRLTGLGENSSHITEFKIDSKNGIAEMNFLVYGISTHIPVNNRIPPPTEKTIAAYMQMLNPDDIFAFYSDNVLDSITAMPDGPLPFVASSDETPLLLWVSSYEPNPGGIINLAGRFKNNWDLTVKINDVVVPISDSTDNFVTAQIPEEQEPGKVRVKIIRSFGLSLEEIGLKLSYDQGNNDIIIASENTAGKFEVKSDLDNGDVLLKHSQHYVYEAEGWRHSFILSSEKINSDIGSSIKGGVKRVNANNDEDLISFDILMDNRVREPGEPIPNAIFKLSGNIFADNELALAPDRKVGELKFSAEMKDYKLSSLEAFYNATNVAGIDKGTLGFRYRPLDETNEHLWNVYTKIEGQLNEVDVQLSASAELEGKFTSDKKLSSLTFKGEAKLGFNISELEIGLGVSGKLQRTRMPRRNTRYRIAGIGEVGFRKIKVIVEGGYGTLSSDRPEGDLSLNLDLGGLWGVGPIWLSRKMSTVGNLI